MKRTIEFNEDRYPSAAEFIKKFNKDELNIKTAELYSAMEIFAEYDIDPLVLAKAIKAYNINFFKLMELIMQMPQDGEEPKKQKRKYTKRVKPEEVVEEIEEITPPVKTEKQEKETELEEGGIDLSASSLFGNNNDDDGFFDDVFQPVKKPRTSHLADLGVNFAE